MPAKWPLWELQERQLLQHLLAKNTNYAFYSSAGICDSNSKFQGSPRLHTSEQRHWQSLPSAPAVSKIGCCTSASCHRMSQMGPQCARLSSANSCRQSELFQTRTRALSPELDLVTQARSTFA